MTRGEALFGGVEHSAALSHCGTYRYELRRVWNPDEALCGWVMLNPSTADADIDDPTIRRCVGFAKGWGLGGIVVVNLFALRATDPCELSRHTDPCGPENENYWRAVADESALTVCAWGAHRMAASVAPRLLVALRVGRTEVRCLGTTKSGAPRHPLYVRGDTALSPFPLNEERGAA